jgi:hypothetical protein
MTDDDALTELLSRPAVLAAVDELGVSSLGIEDVLSALRRFGVVRIDVGDEYTCVLEVPGESTERATGATVLHAAVACWAEVLDSAQRYADAGLDEPTRFLSNS